MSTSRKNVLWADDEIDYLRSHIMFLETRGYSVTAVYSGEDAIHLIRENPQRFDIVLLDEQMMGKDGLTTLEEIKDFLPDLPVVMVTKSEEERVMEDAMGKKIDGYLTKPVNPSQILSVCKRLLDSRQIISSQIVSRYGRSYSAMRSLLQEQLTPVGWINAYKNLLKWDQELEQVDDEGIRQTHAGQKSEAQALFCNFVQEHYVPWINGQGGSPLLTPGVLDATVKPLLDAGEKPVLFVFDSMRLDVFMAIDHLLGQSFNVDYAHYYSILPSQAAVTRKALFSGLYPRDIAQRYRQFQSDKAPDRQQTHAIEERMLKDKVASWGLNAEDVALVELSDKNDQKQLSTLVREQQKRRLTVCVINFIDLLVQSHQLSPLLQEIAPDESSFRRLAVNWFEYSALFSLMKELGGKNVPMVITSSNGCVLAIRATEVYGGSVNDRSLRTHCGTNISCDERYALYIAEPDIFKLALPNPDAVYIVLKENYYFSPPSRGGGSMLSHHSFQQGGISMEEIIMPLAVLRQR